MSDSSNLPSREFLASVSTGSTREQDQEDFDLVNDLDMLPMSFQTTPTENLTLTEGTQDPVSSKTELDSRVDFEIDLQQLSIIPTVADQEASGLTASQVILPTCEGSHQDSSSPGNELEIVRPLASKTPNDLVVSGEDNKEQPASPMSSSLVPTVRTWWECLPNPSGGLEGKYLCEDSQHGWSTAPMAHVFKLPRPITRTAAGMLQNTDLNKVQAEIYACLIKLLGGGLARIPTVRFSNDPGHVQLQCRTEEQLTKVWSLPLTLEGKNLLPKYKGLPFLPAIYELSDMGRFSDHVNVIAALRDFLKLNKGAYGKKQYIVAKKSELVLGAERKTLGVDVIRIFCTRPRSEQSKPHFKYAKQRYKLRQIL
ncbi:hypothetical protein BCV70DRAFT_68811 [Testicularia cyperi]|uniref:Uncharacterized protein n=1 Tax=Testicularia cyperi TaxID=1882483 RepID=A0A317XGQ3_9BASI|nr:hypothetical protein BCV70DRAFT_68811 [Testicularia cyperi]